MSGRAIVAPERLRARAARAAALVALGAAGLALSGCIVNDPVLPPLAVRADDGVLTIALTLCPGVEVRSIDVTPFDASTFPPPVWHAAGLKGDPMEPIRLDASDWAEVEGDGDFASLREFSVDFDTSRVSEGTVISSTRDFEGLPVGEFRVDDRTMTLAEYRYSLDGKLHCGPGARPHRTSGG